MIQQIPYKLLQHAGGNVRKIKSTAEENEQLRSSIASHGLKQNLVVLPLGEKYQVVAGSRRLEALKELHKGGHIQDDSLVDCNVLDPKVDNASEISLAENMMRTALHPVDQMKAFSKLHKNGKGLSVEQIAGRFGWTPLWVSRCLKMGAVNPQLIKAYEDDRITQEALTAFALVEDHEVQMAAYKAIKKGSYREPSAREIRHHLTENKMEANSRLPKFVSLEAYELAGGTLTLDLFADEEGEGVWIDDTALVYRLANEKFEEEVDKRRKQGWRWVQVILEATYFEEVRKYALLDPANGKQHTKAERELSGIILCVEWNGKVEVQRGLVRKEDRAEVQAFVKAKQAEAQEQAQQAQAEGAQQEEPTAGDEGKTTEAAPAPVEEVPGYRHSSTSQGEQVDPVKKALKEAGLSQALVDDLRVIRSNITRWTLAQDVRMAHDVLIYSIACGVFSSFGEPLPLDLTTRATRTHPPHLDEDVKDIGQSLFGDTVEQLRQKHCRWLLGKDEYDEYDESKSYREKRVEPSERWQIFSEMDDDEKLRVAAVCSAMMLLNQTGVCADGVKEVEIITAQIRPNFASFRPTAANYFGRVSRPVLLDILDKIAGEKNPERVKMMRGYKKKDLADMMELMFANPDNEQMMLDEVTKRHIKDWVPPSFPAKA